MVIHQIAPRDKSKWNDVWKKCHDSIKDLPYEIKIWDDKEVDNELISDDGEFYNEYLSKLHPIYKWDYVRYVILERYGGAYLDMDVEIKIDFFPLLNPNKVYLAEGGLNCMVSNHMMISPQDYWFWSATKEQIKYKLKSNFAKAKEHSYFTVDLVGPIALSHIVLKEKLKYTPLSRYHFSEGDTDLQFSIHYSTNNWVTEHHPYVYYGNV